MWTIEGMLKPADKWSEKIPELLKQLEDGDGFCTANEPEPTKLIKAARRPDEFIRQGDVKLKPKPRLGEGNFCVVLLGTMLQKNGTSRLVALKAFKELHPDSVSSLHPTEHSTAFQSYEQMAKEQKELLMEVRTMSVLSHPNVIHFYGVMADLPPLKIVMEYCPGGSLLTHLKKEKDKISVGERLLYAFETARGMHYLESQCTIHRDLAARNCLIAIDSTIKIADFGMSVSKQDMESEVIPRNFRVPIRQMAPETLGRQPIFSSKSDVWAYAVMLWEVFTGGQKPWEDEECKAITKAIKAGKMPVFPESTPKQVLDIVEKCWKKEPADRPTFKSIATSVLNILKSDRFPLPPPNQRTLLNRSGVHERKTDKMEVDLKTKTPRHRRQLFSGRDDSMDETTNERRTRTKGKTAQKSMGARAPKTHQRSTADRTQTTKTTKKIGHRGVSRKTLKD
ncbi:Protein kinase domain-containing protein [Aphelenchoides besseyi]|nr:Protein kinase domain-containing protein [Aphelenchoides besseyi]